MRPCAVQITALPSTSDYAASQIPAGLLPYGTPLPSPLSILVTDVNYTYQPLFNPTLLNFLPKMQRTECMFPRPTGQVMTSALPANDTQHGQVCC